jgi:hypothetical protein
MTEAASLRIRPAVPDDIPEILALIRELAEYEREPQAAVATHADIFRTFTTTRRGEDMRAFTSKIYSSVRHSAAKASAKPSSPASPP